MADPRAQDNRRLTRAYEWLLVGRYLRSKERDGFISLTAGLSVTAIALGVAALITVMSVMNGFRAELLDKILGYHGHIIAQGYGGSIEGYEPLEAQLKELDGVKNVTVFTEQQVMAMRDGNAWGAVVRGLPEDIFTEARFPLTELVAGRLEDAVDAGGVILGVQLARRLGVTAGGEITIVSPKPVDTPFGSNLRYLTFPVAAVVALGVFQFDESFIGMPLGDAQVFFRMGESVSNIEIFIDKPDQVERFLPAVSAVVGDKAYVTGWKSFNQALVGALQTEQVAMFIVLTLIIWVAVFNIASSLFMLVKQKSGDIAILRTMGMSAEAIARVFVYIGLSVGLLGIALGGFLAFLIIYNLDGIKNAIEFLFGLNLWDPSVRFISNINAVVDPFEVAMTIFVAVLLSFLATIIPARRAAKLNPVDILRFE